MRYGIIVTAGDPRTAAELAAEAEAAGWDGVFTWDGVAIGAMETYDPWVVLAAMGMRTRRVRLGAIVTPPSRRRPWKLAREAMSVDRLTDGRLVMPVGLGATDDGAFGNVGEPTDARTRARLLDETLAILEGLWSGEPFGFAGEHYRFEPMTFRPRPVQAPRIPIWIVGAWPSERSMRRTLRWDGIVVQAARAKTPADEVAAIRAVVDYADRERPADARDRPWEVVWHGRSSADDAAAARDAVRPYAEAGATWWIEADWESLDPEALRVRIRAGPPTV